MFTMIVHKKRMNMEAFPEFRYMGQVQNFIDEMCDVFGIMPITVCFYPKWYIEQYSEWAIGMAVCNDDQSGGVSSREIWFCTEFFGYPCSSIHPKHPVKEGSLTKKMGVVIHEFAHHVTWEKYGYGVLPHGRAFRKTMREIERMFGFFSIPFVHAVIRFPHTWFRKRNNSARW